MNLKKFLMNKAKKEHIQLLRRSFEIIGDVMIIDLPEELEYLEKDIVDYVKEKHKHVKTILKKSGEVRGEFRVAKYKKIFGGETETIAKEHGCRFKVDPSKVYYTVKLSGERERIARLVRSGERVLVMFAGVGPYPIVIARLAKPSEVVGIEINPEAVKYFQENVRMNKVEGVVRIYQGDVRDVVPRLKGSFDRIVMPAPYNADQFIDLALLKIKDGGWMHIYTFAGEEEIDEKARMIERRFLSHGFKAEIGFVRECGNFAPRVNRYVFDVRASKVP